MVRKGVLVPLLVAANLLVLVGFVFFVMPFAFLGPCPTGGPEDHGSSPAPSPDPAAAGGEEEALTCLRVPLAVLLGITAVFGFLTGRASAHCQNRFANGAEEEDEASGAATKKAGYVAIADDPEAGASDKN